MKRSAFIKVTEAIYKKYGVKTLFDNTVGKDDGWFIDNEIHLSNNYSSRSIMIAVWCHELGHYIIDTRFSKRYDVKNIFQCEFKAWDIAQQLHYEYFKKPFNKLQGNFCLKCIKTYSKSHYDFRKKDVVYGKEGSDNATK